jgi:hypothetical protein
VPTTLPATLPTTAPSNLTPEEMARVKAEVERLEEQLRGLDEARESGPCDLTEEEMRRMIEGPPATRPAEGADGAEE